ncbi:MAG TPA: DNA mismatch repair endonuclease MutL [Nitrospiraceae bacterium]|nr:DNA mismatch repair endonuclease MutL [Nitrospiraceae bacterium]
MSITSGVGKIHVLPGEVISRIAAGEVIERPAAVIKELIDNSVDAESAQILVEVADGGKGLIRVTDDGEGMTPVDAPLAFQRHATSKLRTEHDLSSIESMGFRGEALPSIASVSKVQVITASREDSVGTALALSGGVLNRQQDTGAAPGTRIEVTDLFFNTPARKKFLKSAATEFSHICRVIQQAAMAWPAIQFRLTHNGQDVLDYPSVDSRRDRILQIYGLRMIEQMTTVCVERPGLRLEGGAIQAIHTRATRSPQELFVNRRPVKNAVVSHAIYDGYGSMLAKGCHPMYVLFLDIDPAQVDVNVHPTKREVRFADQQFIHQTVRQAIRDAVGTDQPHAGPIAGLDTSTTPYSFAIRTHGETDTPNSRQAVVAPLPVLQEHGKGVAPLLVGEAASSYLVDVECRVTPFGQVSQTFLIAQVGTALHVIDQHTAHERVLFERLWREWTSESVLTQPLLIPESIEAPPHGAVLLGQHLSDLAKLGLDIEPFGGTSFVIRSVPALLGRVDYAGLVHDLVDDLAQWNSTTSLEARVRPILASLACHAAVRAGRPMEPLEMKRLIEEWVQEGQPATCPHGRRIALRFSAEELAKIFGR